MLDRRVSMLGSSNAASSIHQVGSGPERVRLQNSAGLNGVAKIFRPVGRFLEFTHLIYDKKTHKLINLANWPNRTPEDMAGAWANFAVPVGRPGF